MIKLLIVFKTHEDFTLHNTLSNAIDSLKYFIDNQIFLQEWIERVEIKNDNN